MRFAPFLETGEFANVGIILLAADQSYFGFEIETQRYKRITNFFGDMDSRLYRQTVKELGLELERIQALIARQKNTSASDRVDAQVLFDELIRARESIVRFSQPGVVLADDPARQLDALHGYYVRRSFVTPEHRETALARGIGQWLRDVNISERFTPARLGNEEFETPKLPFVEQRNGKAVKVVKPLSLDQTTPIAILEHANKWKFRLTGLRERGLFDGRFLFAIDGPSGDQKRARAFEEARGLLTDIEATVVDYRDRKGVINFALEA